MKVLTARQAEEEYTQAFDELLDEYGDATSIPRDQVFRISERLRARYCLLVNSNWTEQQVVSYYSIEKRVAEEMFGGKAMPEPKKRRTDKNAVVKKWCDENVFAEVTPAQIAEIGEFSYATALKYINNNPHTFRKVGHGKYEIRDAVADREAEKA